MTLDEFLRTLETLIDERESTDDDPGEGNFGCEDCRRCNHCRFCIGCDSCQDCTYCEESIDCTSCTQSKRCVGCERVSYCEDCRDCRNSRYLTLCVDCNDCVHCLACVGLDGAEFYVLNEKRTRKEYFALLRQVQALMRERMEAGWRPPAIGLASDPDDPHAVRDAELTAAPWLTPSMPPEPERRSAREPLPSRDWAERERSSDWEERERPSDWAERERPGRRREPIREPERSRWEDYDDYPQYDAPRRAPERRDEYEDRPLPARAPAARPYDYYETDRHADAPRRAHEQPTQPFTPTTRSLGRLDVHRRAVEDPPAGENADPRELDDWDDRPIAREHEWQDSREQTVARPRRDSLAEHDPQDRFDEAAPDQRDHEPSSPWLDEDAQAQARRRAKRGSLRVAPRPKRKPDADPPRESTSSASYRTGSAPPRNEGTHTGTGLRLGRKPKR